MQHLRCITVVAGYRTKCSVVSNYRPPITVQYCTTVAVYRGFCVYRASFFLFNFAAEGHVRFTKPFSTRARMEPTDRTWYTEGKVASISKQFFASHGLEKHVSQALEEMCLNLPESFHITLFIFTVFVAFLATSHLFLTAT